MNKVYTTLVETLSTSSVILSIIISINIIPPIDCLAQCCSSSRILDSYHIYILHLSALIMLKCWHQTLIAGKKDRECSVTALALGNYSSALLAALWLWLWQASCSGAHLLPWAHPPLLQAEVKQDTHISMEASLSILSFGGKRAPFSPCFKQLMTLGFLFNYTCC